MSQKKINDIRQTNEKIKSICFISTVILIALLLMYLAVTLLSLSKLNSQIKLTTEHPFVVSRHVGEVRTNVAQMRIRSERLQSYNQPADVERVRTALDELYEMIAMPLSEIERLYLGPIEDANLLTDSVENIKHFQGNLLEYAAAEGRTKEDITAYEEKILYPLYERIEQGAAKILAFTQNTQMTVYRSSDALWKKTFIWSIAIVSSTIAVLLLFQYILGSMNREIYSKNKQFDTLSHTIDEMFMIFGSSGESCDFVAENALRVIGIPAEALKKNRKQIYDYVDADTAKEIQQRIYSDSAEQSHELSVEFFNPAVQETRWLQLRFYRTEEGNHKTYIMTFTDQTEDIRARRALQDALVNAQNANKAKRDFLSRMSHEIRTPMNAIIGMTAIAAASIQNIARVEDCLSKISYSSKHLLVLINDVLDMSRIESSKLSINNETFDLYQYVNSFVALIYPQAQAKGIEFSEKIIGFTDCTTYIGDSFRLNQILLNLTSNAVKFTERGGSVTLEVKRLPSRDGKDCIRFTVSDTGIGMSQEALKRIYDPFEQADATIAQRYGGTGLGMSITNNLVSLMGGAISITSCAGDGTSCVVELPFTKSSTELENLSPDELKALNVLVVDDEEDVCEHTTLLLEKINIRAKWVLTGAEAVESVVNAREEGDSFDICFIDWSMPDMDGIETTRRIRERVGMETPIIIISAYDWSEIETEARQAGANAFISKPLFLSSIYNVVVNVTNGSFGRTAVPANNVKLALAGKNILVAEDNELNMEIIQEMLAVNGMRVEGAGDGKAACEMFAAAKPGYFDAILMDVQMPVMNGYDAARQIRAMEREDGKTIPIIATTANAFTEDVSAALASGMNAHISKPLDMPKLCALLAELLEKKG